MFGKQFFEKFQEVKEAAGRSSSYPAGGKPANMSTQALNNSTIPPPSLMGSPLLQRTQLMQGIQTQNALLSQAATAMNGHSNGPIGPPPEDMMISTEGTDHDMNLLNDTNANSLMKVGSPLMQKNSAGGPGRSLNIDSPKHASTLGRVQDKSPEAQLKYENERLRLALAQRYDQLLLNSSFLSL